MLRYISKWILVACCLLISVACSNSDSLSDSSNEIDIMRVDEEYTEEAEADQSISQSIQDRMIIHHAELYVSVKNIEATQAEMEKQVHQYKGYVVESSIFKDEHANQTTGMMRVRVPEEKYLSFLEEIEELVIDIFDRTVSGQDVTEEYIDLEARISSKQKVEKRLLQFMDEAEKTEDLLKISNDLAVVQEEIEQLEGQLNYLKNQIDYSTIVIGMSEDHIVSLGNEGHKLDTWKKVKQQLVKSTNFLLYAVSQGTVLIVGNLPVIIIIFLIYFFVFLFMRKRRNRD